MNERPRSYHYLAVFLISLSLLVLEISVARILSVALFSHYAFVAISLAMFGLGLSGLVVYLLPRHFERQHLDRRLVHHASLFALTASVSLVVFLHIHVAQELSLRGFLTLGLSYGVLMLPFFFGGICISLLMTHFSEDIGRIYFADLIGASLGCLVVVLAMMVMPAPWLPPIVGAAIAVVALLTALALAPAATRVAAAATIGTFLLLGIGASSELFTMRYVKTWTHPYADHETWNAFSRVSAFPWKGNAAQIVPLPGPADRYADGYPATMVLDIDGAAWTPMMNFSGDWKTVQFLHDTVLYAVHHVRPNAQVLIIGIGGGRDILAARAFQQPFVQGIELNPLMPQVVNGHYGDYSGRPYSLDGVNVVIDEARSRLHRMPRKFDIIQLSLIDTFSLNAAGGFVFSENNLYTQQAFQEYFRHLSDDGILSLTRYFVPEYPLEILKLAALTRVAWAAEGIDSIADRLVVLHQGMNATALAKRSPFTSQELDTLDAFAKENNIAVVYRPGLQGANPDLTTIITTPDLASYVAAYPYFIAPPTDDQPFFFNFLRHRLATIPGPAQDPFQFLRLWHESLSLMYLLIGVVTTLAVIFFFGPLVLFARGRVAGVPHAWTAICLLYFACLGYGFMMVEIPLLQRLMLLLGYPVYALAVVLFALLLFSGIGSLLTNLVYGSPSRALLPILGGIVVIGTAYAVLVPVAVERLLPFEMPIRIAAAVLLLAPLGLLLGCAYPLGVGVLRRIREGLVPWAWGMNGAMSVVASVLAIFISSRIGFTWAMATGIAAYGVALGCIMTLRFRWGVDAGDL